MRAKQSAHVCICVTVILSKLTAQAGHASGNSASGSKDLRHITRHRACLSTFDDRAQLPRVVLRMQRHERPQRRLQLVRPGQMVIERIDG
jgi:hypothetical protein